ncbi:hypothetical protein HT031_000414 [Scenedesmus sp. PABB004]|nr:hypothetical protein HT031_000414 [Scenedesmus sp. PABB004]
MLLCAGRAHSSSSHLGGGRDDDATSSAAAGRAAAGGRATAAPRAAAGRPPVAACAGARAVGVGLRRAPPGAARRRVAAAAAAPAAAGGPASGAPGYTWSWQARGLPPDGSPFDDAHPIPEQLQAQDALLLLRAAAAAAAAAAAEGEGAGEGAAPPSQAWLGRLLTGAAPLLGGLGGADAVALLEALAALDFTPEPGWMAGALDALARDAAGLPPAQLAGALWALSNLRHAPAAAQWDALLRAAAAQLPDFYGPDLARLLCAAGSIHASARGAFAPDGGVAQPPAAAGGGGGGDAAGGGGDAAPPALALPPGWLDAVAGEAEYQVVEFPGDLGAFDLARLASGLADLGLAAPSARLSEGLLKAVYARTRSIEEKGAVDFALAKLDAGGKRSMHFDPRWTHEELHWLPRRERDKRRIIKEGWYRTQWGGW